MSNSTKMSLTLDASEELHKFMRNECKNLPYLDVTPEQLETVKGHIAELKRMVAQLVTTRNYFGKKHRRTDDPSHLDQVLRSRRNISAMKKLMRKFQRFYHQFRFEDGEDGGDGQPPGDDDAPGDNGDEQAPGDDGAPGNVLHPDIYGIYA